MRNKKTGKEISAKNLRMKLWWTNIVGGLITVGAFSVMVVSLVLGWPAADVAVFGMLLVGGINILRNEGSKLLDVFMQKYRKDHGLADKKEEETGGGPYGTDA